MCHGVGGRGGRGECAMGWGVEEEGVSVPWGGGGRGECAMRVGVSVPWDVWVGEVGGSAMRVGVKDRGVEEGGVSSMGAGVEEGGVSSMEWRGGR